MRCTKAMAASMLALLSACGGGAPARSDAPLRPVAEMKDLGDPGLPPGIASQTEHLKWDRPGRWRQVRIDAQRGTAENVLVARDRFGDRILAARGAGQAVWIGRIECPAGVAAMGEGVVYDGGSARPVPAGAYRQQDPSPGLCAGGGRTFEGTPSQMAGRMSSARASTRGMTEAQMQEVNAAHRRDVGGVPTS